MAIIKACSLSILLFISCTEAEDKLITVSPKCNADLQYILAKNGTSSPVLLNVEDIIKELNGYGYYFELNLPKSIEYCGYIPVFMCAVGEPDTYYMVDSNVSKTYYLDIETGMNDQKQYDRMFAYFEQYPNYQLTPEELEYQDDYKKAKQSELTRRGILKEEQLAKTRSFVNQSTFYGQGTTHYYKSGRVSIKSSAM